MALCVAGRDRVSAAVKGIRVSVAFKGASKGGATGVVCTQRSQRSQLMNSTLARTLNRHPYPDTLNRPASIGSIEWYVGMSQ